MGCEFVNLLIINFFLNFIKCFNLLVNVFVMLLFVLSRVVLFVGLFLLFGKSVGKDIVVKYCILNLFRGLFFMC